MIKIYNTLTKQKEPFVPIIDGKVAMYVCGPTTYNYFHVGNGRAFLFFDVVRRYLKYAGYKVQYVQNLTDIDDKIIKKANEEKSATAKIARKYIRAFKEDITAMGIGKASKYPKATDYVEKMVSFIELLIQKGYAYPKANGDVYFSVRRVKDYGQLSGKKLDQLQTGARVEENTEKEYAGDFVLWKAAKPGEPHWDSPWGQGRPGWHTECVVMVKDIFEKEYDRHLQSESNKLSSLIDIHAGGVDLTFPHHENEIAQAKAGFDCGLADFWMHNGFINIEGEKMSKSLGNFFTVREILKKHHPESLRHFYLSKHYRSSIDFNEDIMKESAAAMKKLYKPIKGYLAENGEMPSKCKVITAYEDEFRNVMNDDFNTSRAVALLFEIAKECAGSNNDSALHTLIKLGRVLGFFQDVSSFIYKQVADTSDDELVKLLIDYRDKFKQEKNWAYADMIRKDLAKLGIVLQDTPEGTKWYREE